MDAGREKPESRSYRRQIYLPTCSCKEYVYGSTALYLAFAAFQILNPIYSLYDSLDGGSAHRKASAYTQNNTKLE
jgi:hypothetical protein